MIIDLSETLNVPLYIFGLTLTQHSLQFLHCILPNSSGFVVPDRDDLEQGPSKSAASFPFASTLLDDLGQHLKQ